MPQSLSEATESTSIFCLYSSVVIHDVPMQDNLSTRYLVGSAQVLVLCALAYRCTKSLPKSFHQSFHRRKSSSADTAKMPYLDSVPQPILPSHRPPSHQDSHQPVLKPRRDAESAELKHLHATKNHSGSLDRFLIYILGPCHYSDQDTREDIRSERGSSTTTCSSTRRHRDSLRVISRRP